MKTSRRSTRKNRCFLYLFIMTSVLLSGCSSTPMRDIKAALHLDTTYKNLEALEKSPAWNIENASITKQSGWWSLYESDELNTLMDYAFANNPNLAQTRSRLKSAQAAAYQTRSSLLPSATISAERDTQNGNNAQPSDFSLIGAASYELDLWGKNRAEAKSDDLEFMASAEDLHAAYITLSASITENWLQLLSLIEQENLARKQVDINQTVLDLQQKRFEMGTASALDILQQQEILAQSESALPDILSSQKQTANAMAYLLGNVPRDALQVREQPLPAPLPIPYIGLPSELLAERPDVSAAWLRLQSADWASKAAWANRLPSFNLSANIVTTDSAINGLFNTWLLDMVAGLTAPVFDGGNRKAQELQKRALADERYHAYREIVLGAVKDVEDALTRNTYQDQKLVSIEKQLRASRDTLEQAQLTYTNGQSSYINVLNSLKNTQSLEQQMVRETLAQSIERVALYRALGGTAWARDLAAKDFTTANVEQ
ncbi:MAG: efflux transporter outer membrane subunit [Alphaproteobacteria bacterium]